MHDIKELEARWKRYRRKKIVPYAVAILLVSMGAIAYQQGWYRLDISRLLPKRENNVTRASVPSQTVQERFRRNETIGTLAIETKKEEIESNVDVPLAGFYDGAARKASKRLRIEVVSTSDRKRLKRIEKRFKLSHDPEDALFLAKQYLRMRKYQKAAYWALQTNRINEKIEESWLIFAIAKAKQGRREEALKILRAYIDKTASVRAKELYGRIRDGKRLPLTVD